MVLINQLWLFSGIKCDNLTAPDNGFVHNGNNRVYEDKANYSCQAGYEFPWNVTHIETHCNATGNWTVSKPTCLSK